MLSWSFNITFFLPSRKPKCVPYTYSTFQLRLAAFRVFNKHRWLVTSGLHRTALDALLVHWLRTPVFCSCCVIYWPGPATPSLFVKPKHIVGIISSSKSLGTSPAKRAVRTQHHFSAAHCLLCIRNHPVRFLSPRRLVQGQGLCHIHPVLLSA